MKLNESEIKETIEHGKRVRRALKQLSKNQLITLIIEQVNQTIDQQNINRILMDQQKGQEVREPSE